MDGKYNFPKFRKVKLKDFSLYRKDNKVQEISEEFNDGVFCLAGANGLGKTTFLTALNYALTGIVLEANKEVYSPKEITKSNKKSTERYFKGRIHAEHEKTAEVDLTFEIGNKNYRIVRGFFEPESLRRLEIYDENNVSLLQESNLSPNELNEIYKAEVSKDIGFSNFDFFAFFQLYVLTFDENRRMIFWDDRASNHALSIAFNTDQDDTENISDLRRRIEKHESDGRNTRWQATQIKKKIKDLQKSQTDLSENDELVENYLEVAKELEKRKEVYSDIEIEYDTLLKNQSVINASLMNLRNEHRKLFSLYSQPRSVLLENTYVKMSLEHKECCLCHAKSDQIQENIKNNLYKDSCPLCGTSIDEDNQKNQSILLDKIEKVDANIAKKDQELDKITLQIKSKKDELDKADYEVTDYTKILKEIENSNPVIVKHKESSTLSTLIENYQNQYEELDKEAISEYRKRDKIKVEYDKLLTKIELAYQEAEVEFVPIFQKFAKSFIGLDLQISFRKTSKGMKLILELEKTARSEHFQLSESQRFFLDIALRMSLAIYLSKPGNEATIMIDTPEGSLDIAYENRVGQMFADFADVGQNIIMTANINASQLLRALAKRCGHNKMLFKRMLDWTDPSIIQKEGEQLFIDVYDLIEKDLSEKDLSEKD